MKTSVATTAAATVLAFLAPVARADFDIYYGRGGQFQNAGFQVFNEEVTSDDCKTIGSVGEIRLRPGDDASQMHRNGQGVARCDGKGKGCYGGNPENIEQLEMNFGKVAETHFTLYKDREWGLYDTSNKKIGDCVPAEGYDRHTVTCGDDDHNEDCDTCTERPSTKKQFFCRSDLNADEILRRKKPSRFNDFFDDLFNKV